MTIAHVSLPVSNIAASRAFFRDTLAPLEYAVYRESSTDVMFGLQGGVPDFEVHSSDTVASSEPQKGNGVHVAFGARNKMAVRAFYAAALAAGATDNGAPGLRSYAEGYYAAYVHDLDGNNIECVYYRPWWLIVHQMFPTLLIALIVAVISFYARRVGGSEQDW